MSRTILTPAQAWDDGWKGHLRGGKLGAGLDVSTTTKKKSNPSALAIVEQLGLDFWVRALVRWKTQDPAITRAFIALAMDLPGGRKLRRLVIDGTSGRFFAADLKRDLSGRLPVEIVVASESHEYRGEKMIFKRYHGNLVVNTANDGNLILPPGLWINKDLRSVQGTTFDADVDENGAHADCFVAIGNAIHALTSGGGPAVAHAVPTSSMDVSRGVRPGVLNPYAHHFGKKRPR